MVEPSSSRTKGTLVTLVRGLVNFFVFFRYLPSAAKRLSTMGTRPELLLFEVLARDLGRGLRLSLSLRLS